MVTVILSIAIAAVLALYFVSEKSAKAREKQLMAENNRLTTAVAEAAAEKAALQATKAEADKANAAALEAADRRLADANQTAQLRFVDLKNAARMQAEAVEAAHQKQLATLKAESAERLADAERKSQDRLADAERKFAEQLAHERAVLDEHFKSLAADVLANSAKTIDERSRASIESVIAPMKTSLDEFTKGYRECYNVENTDRLSLREEIKALHEMSERVGEDARRLSTALRGNNRMQGNWGEHVLANILENSGLEPGRILEYQSTDAEGIRPDAIIHCPDKRDIVIDSKVSLKEYLLMVESETEEEYKMHLAAHLQAVENQMTSLAKKEYHKKVGEREGAFVLMFMPHEGAYMAAMTADPKLWNRAYERHVVIVSPTHLVAVVRLVEQLWRGEALRGNISQIAKKGATMLGLISTYLTAIEEVSKKIDDVRDKVDMAKRQLKGGRSNMAKVAKELQALGVKIERKNGVIPDAFADYDGADSDDGNVADASDVEALFDNDK